MSVGKYKAEYATQPRFAATVVSTERITSDGSDHDVRELVLDVDRPSMPYRIGQSIGVLAPGFSPRGDEFHVRLYSVADLPQQSAAGKPRIKICVRRCTQVDPDGTRHDGIASHYLCDLQPAETVWITGPFGPVFAVPDALNANLILIATGTGIAPFRALVKHIYRNVPGWTGRVWLFYGARNGLELLYMNDKKNDFAQYRDEETFMAFQALSPRPHLADPIAWDRAIARRGQEVWKMLADTTTYVYVAGLAEMQAPLDEVLARLAGSEDRWARRKSELTAVGRWVELLY